MEGAERRYRVLVVEDALDEAFLIKMVLLAHMAIRPYVTVRHTAEEAITYLESLLGRGGPWYKGERPDLIVLDISMPGIGGLGFLDWYSEHRLATEIPVVVFTSVRDPDLARQCFARGAREFKQKPADFRELVPIVQRVLDHWHPEASRVG